MTACGAKIYPATNHGKEHQEKTAPVMVMPLLTKFHPKETQPRIYRLDRQVSHIAGGKNPQYIIISDQKCVSTFL